MAFEGIIGNNKIKQLLETSISTKKILHSYLFSGKEGIGKKLFAQEFAKYILCEDDRQIVQFEEGNHPDYTMISPDGNSIKIEQIRMLQTKIAEKPIESTKKVYVIDDAETMTKEAQNALLKTLEEPPEYGTIILICSNENMLLSTIKSRCTKISFCGLQKEELRNYIEEDRELYENVKQVFENIEKYDKIDYVKKADVLYKSKDTIQEILEYADNILLKKAKQNDRYINCVSIVEKAKIRLKQNANYDMTIDDLCFSLWEEINENNNRSKI